MKPVKFDEATKNLSKPQSMTDEECGSMWIHSDGQQCISCWKMSWKDRLKALFYGKVWVGVISGHSQPPVWIDPSKTVFIKQDGESK